jgi:hypothetical protein
VVNTIDMVAVQRHYLQVTLLTGCRLAAADPTLDGAANTIDIVAMQRFFLGETSGIAHVGQYHFSPTNRSYSGMSANQTAQDYDVFVYGDVATPFASRPENGAAPDAADDSSNAPETISKVAQVALPNLAAAPTSAGFTAGVTASLIDAKDNLVGFQGDFIFDSRVITFESDPVQKAGLTAGNWTVTGRVLDSSSPIKTVRISAFSNDLEPLSGSGTLFELRLSKVNLIGYVTQLFWAAPPDHFIFIDGDLNTQKPVYTAPGSIALRAAPATSTPVEPIDATDQLNLPDDSVDQSAEELRDESATNEQPDTE